MYCLTEVKTDEEAWDQMVSVLEIEDKGGVDADVGTFEDEEGMVNGFRNEKTEEDGILGGLSSIVSAGERRREQGVA